MNMFELIIQSPHPPFLHFYSYYAEYYLHDIKLDCKKIQEIIPNFINRQFSIQILLTKSPTKSIVAFYF